MKKMLKHFPGILILVIATLAILDFSLRAQPIEANHTQVNSAKVNHESPEGSIKETTQVGGQIPMEPVHVNLFPVKASLSSGGDLFAEGSYVEKNEFISLKDPIQESLLPLKSFEENEFDYFLSLVKIQENKNYHEIIASTKKKKGP